MNPADFYPNTEFSTTAPTDAQPVTHSDMELRMFGDNAHADRKRSLAERYPEQRQPTDKREFDSLTDQEKAQRVFGGTDPTLTFKDATQAIFNAGLEDHLHDPETAAEIAADWAGVFAEHELSGTEAKVFADLGAQVTRSPVTPQLVESWTETALAELKSTYGVAGAGQALRDARSYIELRGESVKELLDSLGIGSHPAVVRAAAERGRQLRLQGKLK